jgi:hypothetical protein
LTKTNEINELLTFRPACILLAQSKQWKNVSMSRRPERVSIFLRVAPETKAWLEQLAASHETSVNAEIVRIIRAQMKAQQPDGLAN